MNYYDLDAAKTFLVSQKALIVEEDRLLLLKVTPDSTKTEPWWELPGGLLEMDEPLEAGLQREVREETNLEVSVGSLLASWDQWERDFIFKDGRRLDVRVITLAFICDRCDRSSGSVQLSEEHSEFMWATKTRLTELNLAANTSVAIRMYRAL